MLKFIDKFESYVCQALLAVFVTILFAQIVSRQIFGYSIAWSEELSTYMFVWFAYFGASYATRLGAHNRVSIQFAPFPGRVKDVFETIADGFWLAFNVVFIYLSYDFVFNKMNLFWKSQTLGVPMKYFYMILPIAFTLMSIRILQVNYLRWFSDEKIEDPDKIVAHEEIEEAREAPR